MFTDKRSRNKGWWIDCEVKDGRRVRFHRTGISRVGSVAKERGF